ncbi:dTDP-4-dehydrorhamnose 3,5-epimerase family protein [Nostocoides sp. Soil756]|uniref:dTDP-4-dehydrorhamnose 3,5-epimerase family protein n=1 Tax=Nostocoides sp. Soil756 TaxID=1736399 RepID=UPI000700B505|nr:dTDP-4-dehydrorhamnose 3,5-epimerase family protein [Tetrasphaera sp. Soil756]KRE61251.1 dTDP-4-dehydrorhamnose 3,5-epimerase [Tetrasphaera sp. Soil756]
MEITELAIPGAFVVTPHQHADARGVFLESYRGDLLAEHLGHRPDVVQTNVSVSARGTVRGVHYADVPPGQAKYVTALAGSLLDVIVDLRTGSPTFGAVETVLLDTRERRAVYLAEGLGHAFCALEDGTTALYLCTAAYRPTGEHGVHPLDPDLGIDWPVDEPLLSAKDAAAPTLREASAAGALPTWESCREHVLGLAQRRS